MTHSPLARRGAATVLTLGLAAGALVAGAGVSQADAAVDATGLVTNAAGTPLANIDVTAYTVGTDGRADNFVDTATTDATGRYSLTDLETSTTPQVKILFADDNDYGTNARALPYLTRYLGNTTASKASPSFTVTPGASTAVATQKLPQAAGVAVRILNPAGAPVNDSGSVSLLDPRANLGFESGYVGGGDTTNDDSSYPTPAAAPKDGLVVMNYLDGGVPVKVLGFGNDTDAAGNDTYYLSQFLGGGTSFDKAQTITPVAGQFQDYTITLGGAYKATQAPRIVGNTVVGKTLTADPGLWPYQAGTQFSYQWLRGTTVLSTDPTYTVTKADKKQKIRLVVTAVSGDFISQVSVTSAKVGLASKVKVTKLGDDQLRATVTVAKKKDRKKAGKVKGKVAVYDETGARVSKKAKLKGGSAVLKVQDSAEGKLTVVYLGGGKLGTDSATVGGGKGGGGKGGKGGKKKN